MRFQARYRFQAEGEVWTMEDPISIMSDSATYYVAILATAEDVKEADSLKKRVPLEFLRHAPEDDVWDETKAPHLDVRPTGDPELARNPQFRSLAERPPAELGSIASGLALAMAGASAGAAVVAFYRRALPQTGRVMLAQPALG